MKNLPAKLLVTFLVAMAPNVDRARAASPAPGTIAGWTELFRSGVWSASSDAEKAGLLGKLDQFLTTQPSGADFLKTAARTAHSSRRIDAFFKSCNLETENFRSLAKGVSEGAKGGMECLVQGPRQNSPHNQVADLAQTLGEAQLLQTARQQALGNLTILAKQAEQVRAEDVVKTLNPQLKTLGVSLEELNRQLNLKLAAAKNQKEAEAIAEKVFLEQSTAYEADYAAVLRQPWRALLFTDSMVSKIGAQRALTDFKISGERRGRVATVYKGALPAHAREVSLDEVQKAMTQQRQKLKEAAKALQKGAADFESLLIQFPVSLGQALALTNASRETLEMLCTKLQALEKDKKLKDGIWQALDVGLTAASVVGGLGGLGLRVVGKVALSRMMATGAAAAAAGATTSDMARALETSGKVDLAMQFAAANPALARDPKEMQRLNSALDEYSKARNDVLIGAGMSAAGAGAYLAATRYLSSGEKVADEVFKAAQDLRKSGTDDKSFARSFSKLMSCK